MKVFILVMGVSRGVDKEVFIEVVGIIVVGALIVEVRVEAVVYVYEGTSNYVIYMKLWCWCH